MPSSWDSGPHEAIVHSIRRCLDRHSSDYDRCLLTMDLENALTISTGHTSCVRSGESRQASRGTATCATRTTASSCSVPRKSPADGEFSSGIKKLAQTDPDSSPVLGVVGVQQTFEHARHQNFTPQVVTAAESDVEWESLSHRPEELLTSCQEDREMWSEKGFWRRGGGSGVRTHREVCVPDLITHSIG